MTGDKPRDTIDRYVADVVKSMPPLTERQRDVIANALQGRPARHRTGNHATEQVGA